MNFSHPKVNDKSLWVRTKYRKVATHLIEICLHFVYNSIITKTHRIFAKIFLDKSENDVKIVNRTNVCYKEKKQMEEVTKTLLEFATYEELLILLNLAESMLQPSERTQPSALVS